MAAPAKSKYKICEKCPKRAHYNVFGTRSPRFCGTHREPNMFMITLKRCGKDGCTKVPCFNFIDQKMGKLCMDHKEEGMVNVRQKKCDFEGCMAAPNYNLPSEPRGTRCAKHKTPEMINVISPTCEHKECRTIPSFGFKGQKSRFCLQHKLDGMVCSINRRCEHEGCEIVCVFNFPNETIPKFCKSHMQEGMINIRMKPCRHEGCRKTPVFNFPIEKNGIFCKNHKLGGMVDVENSRCKTPMCEVHAKEYCARCTSYLFPDRQCRFKTRETKVKEYLEARYTDKTIIHDKRVECHLYRPDFVFDMGSHTVVIELDENQHKRYDTSCDNKRLMSIFHGLGSRPMVMMRFNPDRYDSVPGCFKKDGQLVDLGRPWKRRLESLAGRIDHWLESQPDREITIEHLFFDTDK